MPTVVLKLFAAQGMDGQSSDYLLPCFGEHYKTTSSIHVYTASYTVQDSRGERKH